jgi:hypothetical protein
MVVLNYKELGCMVTEALGFISWGEVGVGRVERDSSIDEVPDRAAATNRDARVAASALAVC